MPPFPGGPPQMGGGDGRRGMAPGGGGMGGMGGGSLAALASIASVQMRYM